MRSGRRGRGAGPRLAALLALPALAVLLAGAATAAPEVAGAAGTSLGATGDPGGGGAAATLAVLWPVEGRFAFGVGLFADDLGTGFIELHDPNTGGALGRVASTHRWSFGGEWRAEARLHETRRVRVLWGAGFGYGRQEQDQRGQVRGAASGVVASTGATFLVKAPRGHALGATLSFRREFVRREADPGRSTSWATAALEWRWRGVAQE